ncbi:FAD-binding oxidoreductase [Lentibacter algarum]|uniref:NAD(P)/FAD-dependent oxidoreductase n=1 Tax=Lentibacter algarum TaxID=576131 RepID=UPI001C09CAD6|nr:FAD-binding oxidoreductase [Lentibacter algarum]MBU2983677.1 FAD-binding oxidoreductase [Lentibacter algarum]
MPSELNEIPLWPHTAVPRVETPQLISDLNADVLIVGAGYTGLSAALHLAEGGADVIVIEAEEFGFGGSGRNAGLVNPGVWLTPQEVDQRIGAKAGDKLNAALDQGPEAVFGLVKRHNLNCDAYNGGTIYLAHNAGKVDYLKQRHAQMSERGATCEVVGGEETVRLTGSQLYRHGGLFDPRAGTIHPMSYTREMARVAQQFGARLFQNARIGSLAKSGGKWVATHGTGTISAEQVILATNAYSDNVLPKTREATIPVGMFHVATDVLDPEVAASIVPERHGVWDTRTVMLSTRIDPKGRLIMCSAGSLKWAFKAIKQAWVTRARDRLYPQVKGAKWSFHWSGTVGFTPNHLPRVHSPEAGLIIPLGYNGRGIGNGTVIGKACADYVQGAPLSDFPLPLHELSTVGMRTARSAYYEFGSAAMQFVTDRG